MTTPYLSIIIPTFNRPERLDRCLESLALQNPASSPWEVIVVNDGGVDISRVVGSFRGRMNVVLLNQENGGPASARNHGAMESEAELIAFLDDDCVAEPEWVGGILKNARPGELIGGQVKNRLTRNIFSETCQTLIDYLYVSLEGTTHKFFTSNNMCVYAGDFRRIGGFDTSFRQSAGEDREFCVRAAMSGIILRWVPEIRIGHMHDLNLPSFIGLHFKYGRATYNYRKAVRRMGIAERTGVGIGFYLKMLLHPFRKGLEKPFIQSLLLALSQVCTFFGFLHQSFLSRE
jgi:glycosyltransferase involved in cell wall biosynthesis